MSNAQKFDTDDLSSFLSSIEEIIDDARNGRMFILVDDEERENEGDLVIPAQMATPARMDTIEREDLMRLIGSAQAKAERLMLMVRNQI